MEPKIGHMPSTDANMIGSLQIDDGQVIYDEYTGMQRVDYKGSMHFSGGVLSGSYDGTKYTNFESVQASSLDITSLSNVRDGQIIKCADGVYQVRKIDTYTFLTRVNEAENYVEADKIGYIINIPSLSTDNANIDILLSISNDTNGEKIFLLKVVDNALDLTKCKDTDGDFDSASLRLNIVKKNNLFALIPTVTSRIKVISYSVLVGGTRPFSEGFYVFASNGIEEG